jgi:hypothetical protein
MTTGRVRRLDSGSPIARTRSIQAASPGSSGSSDTRSGAEIQTDAKATTATSC